MFLLTCLLANGCSGKTKVANEGGAATPLASTEVATVAPDGKFSADELDELLSPIALYPDPLLAQMVPASTFIDQLEEANRVLGGKSDDNLIADQSWDVSVKSVAHYPQVLQMMVEKSDWTSTLGQAYVNQSTDVGKSIQRLRAEARAAGNLQTSPQQEVITEGEVIRIEPAQPQVIYVPQYDPQVVYVDKGPSTGAVVAASLISFGAGLAIGAWLNNDWDYYGRGVYYHGWSGSGWVARNRTFVNVNRNVYVNNSFRNINLNRTVVNRNTSSYRTNLNRDATVRRERVNATRRDNNVGDHRGNIAAGLPNRANAGRINAVENRPAARTGAVTRNKPSFGTGGARISRPNAGGGSAKSRTGVSSAGLSKPNRSGGGARSRPSHGGGRGRRG
jgi:hypothetical protein